MPPPIINGPVLCIFTDPPEVAGFHFVGGRFACFDHSMMIEKRETRVARVAPEGNAGNPLLLMKWNCGGYNLVFNCCDWCNRQDGPSMLMMMEWCTIRSTVAAVITGSPR